MKGKSILKVGVAAVALLASAQAGFAGKASSDGTSGMTVAQSGPSNDELSARVDALEAELQASEVREAADHDKVSSWKPMAGWWDNTTISGRMYFDITNVDNKNAGVASSNNGTSFDIKRFYLGVDHKFNDVFSANLTTDFTYDSPSATTNAVDGTGNPATLTVKGSNTTQIYIKKAYLQAKLDDAFIVRVGSADLPWVPFAEDVYGYRYIENTVADRTKFGTSADWGLHVLGKFADGLIAYQFSAITGKGYKAPIRTNSPDFEGRVSLNYEGFQLAVGGYSGKLGVQHGTATMHTAERLDALAAYTGNGFRVGVEYFTASNWTQVTSATSSHGTGYSPFASYQFDPEWAVFGRYDYVKPYSDAARSAFHNDYYNVGIEYTPVKIVNLALVYKHDGGSNGTFADANGTIGGAFASAGPPVVAVANGAYDEIGLFGQFRW